MGEAGQDARNGKPGSILSVENTEDARSMIFEANA